MVAANDPTPKKPNIIFRLLALLVTAVLILGALLLVVYRDRFNLDALARWVAFRNVATGETGQAEPFTHAGGDALDLAFLDQGILLSSVSGAHYYSIRGEQYAEQVFSMERPVLSACDKAGVVYDTGGQSLFLFQSTEPATELTLDATADILSARVNDNGWLAVTAQQSGYKGSVTVYNAKHEKAIQINLSSTFVVDAAISSDCRRVAVITMDQSGGIFQTKLLIYPINRTEPSAQLDLGNLVVLDMEFEDDHIWLLSDDRLLVTDADADDVNGYSFGHRYLKGYHFGGDGFSMLLFSSYESGNADESVTLDTQCQVLGQLPLSGQVLDFDCAGGYAALLTGGELTLYDRTLAVRSTLDDPQGARCVALRPDSAAVLADYQHCWLYLPN